MRTLLALGTLCALLSACADETPAPAENAEPEESQETEAAMNLDLWLERLEVGSREFYAAREAVVSAVGLKEGDWVADIGAGTGLYTILFSEKVGADGAVFAEDIEPLFLDLINRRTSDGDIGNVTTVLGREDDVLLPRSSFDTVFIADTYHYFSEREAIMRSVYDALKPGAALILIEFDIETGEERPPEKSHVRFGRSVVISELEYFGFEFVETVDVEGLDDAYFIRLRRPAGS